MGGEEEEAAVLCVSLSGVVFDTADGEGRKDGDGEAAGRRGSGISSSTASLLASVLQNPGGGIEIFFPADALFLVTAPLFRCKGNSSSSLVALLTPFLSLSIV